MPIKRVNQHPVVSTVPRRQSTGAVKIVWKGQRISKVVFPGGKTVEFEVA